MAKHSQKQRTNLPKSKFALGKGRFPIQDHKHAQLALNPFFQRNLSSSEKSRVNRNVYAAYPELKPGNSNADKAFSEGHQMAAH